MSDSLKGLSRPDDPNLIVGFDTSDDAAVYRLAPDLAVISTVDFITPPVDDPYWFGQIAAANALSDVYAMGGKPVSALNLVMFPSEKLPIEQLQGILKGGHDKVMEAGASLAGGHSVDDIEPKYGLSVTGTVHPDRVLLNSGVRDGDVFVLTKPVGIGVLFNACRSGKLPYADLEPLLQTVAALNRTALEKALQYDIHACTDITGFGIAGHALEMAKSSGMEIDLFFAQIPLYPNAVEMYGKRETTRSNTLNRDLVKGKLEIRASLSKAQQEILYDPQTSGGLLFALPESQAEELADVLRKAGVEHAAVIGKARASKQPGLRVL